MHSLWLVLDFIGSYYVTVGFIAGTFAYVQYDHPWYSWVTRKMTNRELGICMIVALPFSLVVAARFGVLFHI
jgi:hypothetical protein